MLHQHLARFGVLGIPIDAFNLAQVIDEIDAAIGERRTLTISTINTNFLVSSQNDPAFRESLAASDLCTVDGIGVLLVCHLLSAPVGGRVSGADILEQLFFRETTAIGRPLRVFFFGGAPGMAEAAGRKVDQAASPALRCVGTLDPGFGSLEELSRPEHLAAINAAKPDILLVALGAAKGQAWLLRNGPHLAVPVRSHFGAAIGFLGGTVRRAPRAWQAVGLEWAWRIRQEPALASRYWRDGLIMLCILLRRILPEVVSARIRRMRGAQGALTAFAETGEEGITLRLAGTTSGSLSVQMRQCFDAVRTAHMPVRMDLQKFADADVTVLGEIMRLRQDLWAAGDHLTFSGVSPAIARRLGLAHGD